MAPVKNMVYFVSFILLILLSAGPVCADEIHTWVDKKGNINITDKPPDNPAKVIDSSKYELSSPEEIRRYEAKKRSVRERRETVEKYNQALEDRKRAIENRVRERDEINRAEKMAREKRAAELAQDMEIEKARLQAIENRNYREAERQRNKLKQRDLERQYQN